MNHGGIGYLDKHRLVLPVDLLRPLSIGDGSRVVGLYYPPPRRTGLYRGVTQPHDFMLSPVPSRYWPVTGRLLVRLRHRPGALDKVASWLERQEVTIITAECCRSGYRYASWNLTIALDNLLSQPNPYVENRSEHEATQQRVEDIRRKLESKFSGTQVLFRDSNDPGLAAAVEAVPARAHSYFHQVRETRRSDPLLSPFTLHCTHSSLRSEDGRLGKLLSHLEGSFGRVAPTCVLAEMDTRDFNLRVAVIPPQELPRFFTCRIPYGRSAEGSSRGLLARVAVELGPRFNLWRVSNLTSTNDVDWELGEVRLVVEDTIAAPPDADATERLLREALLRVDQGIRSGSSGLSLTDTPTVTSIRPSQVLARFEDERAEATGRRFDVFLSYAKEEGDKEAKAIRKSLVARGLRVHLDTANVAPGEPWMERLISSLRESHEVAVVCTPTTRERNYVALEVGAAKGLGRTVTGILCNGLQPSEAPEYLRDSQMVFRGRRYALRDYALAVRRRAGMVAG